MAHIVNDRNEYFAHIAAKLAPRYDGDDDHFVGEVVWTRDVEAAARWSSARAAETALRRLRARFLLHAFGNMAVLA